ncbi:MAG: hypothetical protein IKN66_11555 [Ruminococcus sp.]|nr:hypothetical protein [Ruminococcus sp.]
MKIKKLSKKLDFNVEAQARPCGRDCPVSYEFTNNKSLFGIPSCFPRIIYTSWISKVK